MQAKFNWGGNGATLGRMKRLLVMLPVDDDGKPDYGYMAQYASEMRGRMLMRYRNYVAGQLSQLEYKDIPALDEKEWKAFTLGEIFNNFHGHRLNIKERQSGKIPMLTAGDADNGVSAFISNRNMPTHENFISIDMFCCSFYHPYTATGDDNIYFFENDTIANDTKRFISVAIEKQSLKFSYGKQFRQKNADALRIMLPVDDTGKPDYAYMAQYAKNTMLRKYRQYLAFLDKRETESN